MHVVSIEAQVLYVGIKVNIISDITKVVHCTKRSVQAVIKTKQGKKKMVTQKVYLYLNPLVVNT